jgi:hypothetical protein
MANTTFNWQFRQIMRRFRKSARLQVLMLYVLHANKRGRAWPSVKLLCQESGYKSAAVVEAKQWLVATGALEVVEYNQRVDEETNLHQRQAIMQVTGQINIDGVVYDYLYNNEFHNVNISPSEILPSEISPSETEGIDSSKGIDKKTSDNGTKPKPRPRNEMFDAIVDVSKIDGNVKKNGGYIAQAAVQLKDAGYTPADVLRFGEVWYARDYPGGKTDGNPPSVGCIMKYIGWVKEDTSVPDFSKGRDRV